MEVELIQSGSADRVKAHLGKQVEVEGVWMIKVVFIFKG